jgi:hypothetical protein
MKIEVCRECSPLYDHYSNADSKANVWPAKVAAMVKAMSRLGNVEQEHCDICFKPKCHDQLRSFNFKTALFILWDLVLQVAVS